MSLAALKFAPSTIGRIHNLGFGWLNLGGKIVEQDRILHPEGISGPWWRQRRHRFGVEDLRAVEQTYAPELLILGCGWMGMLRIAPEIFPAAGCAVWTGRTPEAVQRYQHWSSLGIRCVACLHMTC